MNKIFSTTALVLFFGLVQAQNVGIGTTTPTTPLTIRKDGIGLSQENTTAVSKIGFYTTVAACYLQTHTNTDLSFSTNNGSPQLTLQKTTGYLGIGTSAPNQKLEIKQGRLRFTGDPASGTSQGIEFTDVDGSDLNGFMGTYNDSMMGLYGFQGAGWKFLFNNKTGNVGLQGNNNPQVALSFASSTGKKISLYRGTTGDVGMGVFGNEFRLHSDYNGSDITFGYDNLTNGFTEAMRVRGNGNVGIGLTNPSEKLEVNGTTKAKKLNITGTLSGGFDALAQFNATGSGFNTIFTGGIYGAYIAGTSSSGLYVSGAGDGSASIQIDNGRLKLKGNLSNGNAHGIMFTNNAGSADRGFIGMYDDNTMGYYGSGGTGWGYLWDVNDGSLRLGTTQKATGYLLNVGGKIIAEEVRVQLRSAWPDYVFAKNYRLTPLAELETYIQANNHLPNVPAAAEVETSGIALGEMQKKMMEKIEELTLYIIALEKKVQALQTGK